jgi:hypothetical protein
MRRLIGRLRGFGTWWSEGGTPRKYLVPTAPLDTALRTAKVRVLSVPCGLRRLQEPWEWCDGTRVCVKGARPVLDSFGDPAPVTQPRLAPDNGANLGHPAPGNRHKIPSPVRPSGIRGKCPSLGLRSSVTEVTCALLPWSQYSTSSFAIPATKLSGEGEKSNS